MQTLSAILCVTLVWTPFGVSWADAIQAAGRDGQHLGQQIIGGFEFPIDTGNGTLTLNPGTAQESAISIGTLFPDTNSATTTTNDFANLYGNNPGTQAAGLNAQTTLNGETSFTGEAYRTLIDNAHQSHPDLQADPIWQNGDQVFSDFTPWSQSFSDCTTTTTQTETQQSVRVPDYQLCLRQPTVPQSCTATHQVNVEPLIRFVGGDGGMSSCGPGYMDLYVGRVGDDYWESDCGLFTWQVKYEVLHPEAITSATLEYVKALYGFQGLFAKDARRTAVSITTIKIPVIPAGIAGIQMPRMASTQFYAVKSDRMVHSFVRFRHFCVIINVHLPVNWIPAIPAGMTWGIHDRYIY